MGSEIRFPVRGAVGAAFRVDRTTTKSKHSTSYGDTNKTPDRVSLSRAYHVIKSQELQARLDSLGLQVSERNYLLPATIVSRSMVAYHLGANSGISGLVAVDYGPG